MVTRHSLIDLTGTNTKKSWPVQPYQVASFDACNGGTMGTTQSQVDYYDFVLVRNQVNVNPWFKCNSCIKFLLPYYFLLFIFQKQFVWQITLNG